MPDNEVCQRQGINFMQEFASYLASGDNRLQLTSRVRLKISIVKSYDEPAERLVCGEQVNFCTALNWPEAN